MPQSNSNRTEEALKVAREILESNNRDLRTLLYKDIVLNALGCQKDELDILDLKVINRAVSEFRHAACVFKPYRTVRKVSIFGSARVAKDNPYYELATRFARLMVEKGFMVITGAAGGIMTAGIEGAGSRNSFGVNILLPFESGISEVIKDDPKIVKFKYFFTRKIFFVMEADAAAFFPGGFGTHDEESEVLTLLQTGKAPPMPVVLMDLPGESYWKNWDQFVKDQLLSRHFISKEDLSFYKVMNSPVEGVEWIKSFYSTYNSMRLIKNRLVIRLERQLADEHLAKLNQEFKDLFKSGEINRITPLPEEADEPSLLSKPRITFSYNHKSAGRLNQMIWRINELGGVNNATLI